MTPSSVVVVACSLLPAVVVASHSLHDDVCAPLRTCTILLGIVQFICLTPESE